MRFLGLWEFTKMVKKSLKNYFYSVFVLIITLSLITPILFLQKGVASNTSQFLQYFILLIGILAGITVSQVTTKFKFLIPLVIVLMIPTQVGLLREFYSRPAFAKISQQELSALKFVKENTNINDVIITPPYNQYLNLKGETPNIWDWFDTSYVSAFSSRRTYMDDYEQNDIMGYVFKPRNEIKRIIFESKDDMAVEDAILKTNANLIS
jgi:hypothetical protein